MVWHAVAVIVTRVHHQLSPKVTFHSWIASADPSQCQGCKRPAYFFFSGNSTESLQAVEDWGRGSGVCVFYQGMEELEPGGHKLSPPLAWAMDGFQQKCKMTPLLMLLSQGQVMTSKSVVNLRSLKSILRPANDPPPALRQWLLRTPFQKISKSSSGLPTD